MDFKSYYLQERFLNLIGTDKEKLKYVDQVWDILQKSYENIGGIKGSGFTSKEDMVANIPFWKLSIKDSKVNSVVMYKDKNGRKSVAIGTDGTTEGKTKIAEIISKDIFRAFGEKSGASLGLIMKTIPWPKIETFIKTPEEVKKILPDDKIIPLKDIPKEDWEDSLQKILNRYPFLIDYIYFRKINNQLKYKVLIGTTGLTIK